MIHPDLRDRLRRAETAEEIAEICRIEAEREGGPLWCPTCGIELSTADTTLCSDLEYGAVCGVELFGFSEWGARP